MLHLPIGEIACCLAFTISALALLITDAGKAPDMFQTAAIAGRTDCDRVVPWKEMAAHDGKPPVKRGTVGGVHVSF